MMECRDTQNLLSAYLEGLLSSEDKRIVEGHLPSCELCRTCLEDMKRAKDILRDLEEVEPPPWLASKIMANVREKEKQKAGFLRALFYPLHIKVPVQVLGVILIGVLAFQIYRVTEPEMKPMQAPVPSVVSPLKQKRDLKEESQGVPPKPAEVPPAPAKQPSFQGVRGVEEDQEAQVKYAAHDREEKTSTDEMSASAIRVGEGAPVVQGKISADKANAPLSGKGKEPEARPSYPAAGLAKESALRAGAQAMPLIVVATDNVSATQSAAEDILKQLGAKEIGRNTEGTALIMTIELPSEKIKELTDRFKTIGDVKAVPSVSKLPQGTIQVRLEITPK